MRNNELLLEPGFACVRMGNCAKSLAHCLQNDKNCLYVEERASDLAEMAVPVIWQNSLNVEEHASDLAELPVPVIWQNCLSVDSVSVIWHNCP
jgi:hypothetical protein